MDSLILHYPWGCKIRNISVTISNLHYITDSLKVEYNANAKYKFTLKMSEKIACVGQKVNVSNNGRKKIPYHASCFLISFRF